MALAADQRAMAFAGFLAAGVVAAIGGAAVVGSGEAATFRLASVLVAGLLAAFLCAVLAARPIPFEYPGNTPSSWYRDADRTDIDDLLAEQAVHYDGMIACNNAAMVRNSRWLTLAMWLTFGTLAVVATLLVGIGF